MMFSKFVRLRFIVLFVSLLPLFQKQIFADSWSIPVGGNAYRTAPSSGGSGLTRSGRLTWSGADEVHSIFFRVDRPAVINLKIKARVPDGKSTLSATVDGKKVVKTLQGSDETNHSFGNFDVGKAGYVRVDLRGLKRQGNTFAEISDLLISSETKSLVIEYVKTSDGGMFYWGRRGPSVHLRYQVPRDVDLKYAYSEITVPQGQDPIGSYFMANGFGQGYFGIQVNSATERRILFSVWSPFKTDNPAAIPADQRIENLGNGPGVHVGKFGNEGSGGQSYLVFPWKAGVTYRFLTEVKPDGKGSTVYTSWFSEKDAGDWRLVASFRRPKTNTHLTGFHSFLESFSPNLGYIGRGALYGNTWVGDSEGHWTECTKARFSVDATGGGRHRLDFNGGARGDSFFMRNCGFFDETGKPGEWFERSSTNDQQPKVVFEKLPRG
jgi:hypothetical protein